VILTAILWANPGQHDLLVEYEDAVLQLIPKHGGRVLSRVRAEQPGDGPYEVQTIELPSDDALAAYMTDPVRVGLAEMHARAIARTEVVRGGSVL
jgi:uncharacterized protein (DUF1330 family)